MDVDRMRKVAEMDQSLELGMIAAAGQARMLGRFRKELVEQGFSRKEANEMCSTFLSTSMWIGSEINRQKTVTELEFELGDDDDES